MTGGGDQSLVTGLREVKPKAKTTKDTKLHEGIPVCVFLSFAVERF
jgi:hypothetical protein